MESEDAKDIRRFLKEFRDRLAEAKTDKQLIRMINENLQAFGPHSTGSNLLINRYLPKQDSLLCKMDTLLAMQAGDQQEESKEEV